MTMLFWTIVLVPIGEGYLPRLELYPCAWAFDRVILPTSPFLIGWVPEILRPSAFEKDLVVAKVCRSIRVANGRSA